MYSRKVSAGDVKKAAVHCCTAAFLLQHSVDTGLSLLSLHKTFEISARTAASRPSRPAESSTGAASGAAGVSFGSSCFFAARLRFGFAAAGFGSTGGAAFRAAAFLPAARGFAAGFGFAAAFGSAAFTAAAATARDAGCGTGIGSWNSRYVSVREIGAPREYIDSAMFSQCVDFLH
jgi:hypothetical protein